MDRVKNIISRLKSVWNAVKTPTEEERARDGASMYDGYPTQGLPPIEPSPDLLQFRLLTGIIHDKSFRAPNGFKPDQLPINTLSARPAPNMGIYTRVYAAEIKCKKNFKSTSLLINSCLGLQIVVAAALTALGAANHSGSAVTVFGAINTVIAGFLTYLKGSGLPNRIKYYQHEWAKVREYIEQRERDLQAGHRFDVMQEVEVIRQMYESVKNDIEMSQPDRFVGANTKVQPLVAGHQSTLARSSTTFHNALSDTDEAQRFKSGVQSRVRDVDDLEKGLASFGKGWFHDKQTEANAAIDKARHFDQKLSGNISGLKSRLDEKIRDIGHMGLELEDHGRAVLSEKRGEATNMMQSTVREVNDIGHDIESQAREVLSEQQKVARDALTRRQDAVNDTLSHHEALAHAAITEKANAARAAILESELAAKSAILSGQSGASDAIAAHSHAAATAVAEADAAVQSAARNVVENASAPAVSSESPGVTRLTRD